MNRFKGKCMHCGKLGHKGSECWYANGKEKNGKKTTNKKHITCFKCGKKGHYQSECLDEDDYNNRNVNEKENTNDNAAFTINTNVSHKEATNAPHATSTHATKHRLGREGTLDTKPDQISGGDLDDHTSKSIPEQISDGDLDLVHAAIDVLLHFAFYLTKHLVEPTNMSLASINFNEAYIQQPIVVEPATFWEAYDHPDPFKRDEWHNAIRKELAKMEWKSPTILNLLKMLQIC